MALSWHAHGLVALGVCALVVAFAAATQDIAIDAWRIEIAADADELGLLTSAYTLGYRIALLCSESVILLIAQRIGWNASYMLCGVVMARRHRRHLARAPNRCSADAGHGAQAEGQSRFGRRAAFSTPWPGPSSPSSRPMAPWPS